MQSLLNICCAVVKATIYFEQANIPAKLKDKLCTQAKRCHFNYRKRERTATYTLAMAVNVQFLQHAAGT